MGRVVTLSGDLLDDIFDDLLDDLLPPFAGTVTPIAFPIYGI